MKKLVTLFIMFCTICIHADAYSLGALFNRRVGSNAEHQLMWIKSVDVSVDIQDQIAVTHVDQIFHNDMNTRVEAVYIFPLPENAMITELVYWFNGTRYVAEIREREQAVNDYNNRIRQMIDPALLEYLGDNLFRLKIAPINANSDVRTEITYVELLKYDFGRVNYSFMLNALGLSPKELETVSVNVNVQSQSPFRVLNSPSHENSTATHLQKVSDHQYAIMFGDENFYPDKDFVVEFETVRSDVDVNVLTYTPVAQDSFGTDSFYALWVKPPDDISQEDAVPKDIIFTADVSSSMNGVRIAQLKEAMRTFLDLLNPQDRFNIITFGTFVTSFQPDLVPANDDYLPMAREFVYQMYAMGMTNIDEALNVSLNQSFGDEASANLIFLTDGNPTYGETRISQIIENSQTYNTDSVRIFTFGIGENLSQSMIINLARENHGYPTFITADDSIAHIVTDHFTRISKPVWTNLSLDFGGLNQWDFYPKRMNDLFWGSQVSRLGLYTNDGTFDLTLTGQYGNKPVSLSKSISFDRTPGQGHRFVPRIWAKAKIDHLLELIKVYGETDELVDQVTELSLHFQILTQYTALYSDPFATAVDDDSPAETPDGFVLYQNYPNPFNATTSIQYVLPQSHHVVIKIYDALGRLVKTLVNANQSAGSYTVTWDSTDQFGKIVSSGMYFYTLQVGKQKITRKMLLLQ